MVSPKYPSSDEECNDERDSNIDSDSSSHQTDEESDNLIRYSDGESDNETDPPMTDSKIREKKGQSNPDDMFFQNYSMNPTIAEQMTISLKRKRMSSAINVKRKMLEVILIKLIIF